MRKIGQLLSWILAAMMVAGISCTSTREDFTGKTEIAKWSGDKKAAISLTWDDGSINQFRIALPIMDSLDFPATFYIITGQIPGSQFKPEFVGRPMEEIITESEDIPTSPENLFERASLAAYAPYRGLREYHTRAGELFESDRVEDACQEIDRGLELVRSGELKKIRQAEDYQPDSDDITWNEIQSIAREGHEFGSHTISHPRLSVLDEKNMLRELEKSREDILNFLGESHVFSAECPYGTEDERVMKYAHEIYPALRNRMPADYLTELNRGSRDQPGSFRTEYVQWQRGPLSATPMELMKSWVDTCLVKDNIWLVLVFHGVEGIGWESKTRGELSEYFHYIKDHEDQLWVATFRDVTKYMRERMAAKMEVITEKEDLRINLTHSLDPDLYDYPLSLKTYIPDSWIQVRGEQNGNELSVQRMEDENGTYLLYEAIPNGGEIMISGG
jgi:peptidoglycan/xylan/chitin deacetylase (PgdA/CDA1 family)